MKRRIFSSVAAAALVALAVVPALPALAATSTPAPDFVLLGVNVEPDPKPAGEWLKKQPATFPVLYDVKSQVSDLYKVSGMPTTVWVDKKGNLRLVHQSYKPGDENEYMNNIRMLMREK